MLGSARGVGLAREVTGFIRSSGQRAVLTGGCCLTMRASGRYRVCVSFPIRLGAVWAGAGLSTGVSLPPSLPWLLVAGRIDDRGGVVAY